MSCCQSNCENCGAHYYEIVYVCPVCGWSCSVEFDEQPPKYDEELSTIKEVNND